MLLLYRGYAIALGSADEYRRLLVTGLMTLFAVQTLLILGGGTGLLPLTGITLPFVSYGGSSLVANYILLALLMRVSDSAARRLGETPDVPTTGERWRAWRLRRRLGRQGVPDDAFESGVVR